MDNKFTLSGLDVPCHFVADGMLMVAEFEDIMVGGGEGTVIIRYITFL